jgi:pimeloyl-ACP methyl ester carboxylesterase
MIKLLHLICVFGFLSGCASWLPAPVPMKAIEYPSSAAPARCLMVFLPGLGDTGERFEQRGFVSDVHAQHMSIDMVATDASLGYYAKGILTERLFNDVVKPRARRGYEQVWLVGMSMGGLGTLLYSRQRPVGEVYGVLALSPYLGEQAISDEVRSAGGLHDWQAPAPVATMNASNYTSELWRWLQAVSAGREPGPQLYVGYGLQERLAQVDMLLGDDLPSERAFTVAGGHHWDTWQTLFVRFLSTDALAGCK